MLNIYWYDGNLVSAKTLELAIDDPGLVYGATVFTTLRVYQQLLDSSLTNWAAHCDRLHDSIQTFGWQQPNWQRLQQGATKLIPYFPVLRITIFPDGREWIAGRALPANLTQMQHQGVTAAVVTGEQYRRWLPAHKTGNYIGAWLAKTTAQHSSAQEAILIDETGNWLETSTGNLWGWSDHCWWTPPLAAGILPGVGRSQLLNWLHCHNQLVKQEPWSAQLVSKFEAIAYSNSVVEVIPIHTVIETQSSTEQIKQLSYDPNHYSLAQLRQLFST